MVSNVERHPRADAVRNAERILRTARAAFADDGPDVSLDEIARRAGVGLRTLHRHFPQKGDLVRAILDRSVAEDLAPAIERALAAEDPLRGLTALMETAVAMVAREQNTIAAARNAGSLTADLSTSYFEALTRLAQRAQQAGMLRADLVPGDLPRIMAMLVSVLWSMTPDSEGWRRYLGFVLDGLSPVGATTQPAAVPLLKSRRSGDGLL
ncbi:AcrR family transcriptional regulator [Kibdelosporangium banguiense]|uniref:AcrR family transcriptional regulator n=1 Tax=Kibdelosporangium banguiense TaxID=1365924 RepID=A0ABS4TY98_9PSEU|nr:TetR/AcrR family transcriptional regulator [Kibdelosporangium banguiense]MBP2329368.1 AcrR family transcriptional regulator [Kibdelosporangium banguiense]